MSIAHDLIPPQPAPPAPPRAFTLERLAGIVFMGVWLAAIIAAGFSMVEGFSGDKFARYAPKLLSGLMITLELVAVSIILGAILSLPIAFARMSSNRLLSTLSYGYVYLFRGTPLIAQLFLVYYGFGSFKSFWEGLGLWWFFREAYYCAILSFALNTAAYQAEILRGAIESVARGQVEACHALGLNRFHAYRKVILPQAIIVALRPYGNEIILMIKASAIVSIVTVLDVMGETRRAFSRTFDYQIYIWAAVIYLVIVEALRNLWNWLEARLTRHLKR
ncbi:ABC transporter permease [Rhizobium sp. FKL33]|uniref:ABC transporter permease n=1 Tax=Rhizobium sp. FKL33 TaxID=2562307 RepID=UPI0010C052E9|nr:ABC transporter permease [Rhizobium sp. FKL33]